MQILSLSNLSPHQITKKLCAAINQSESHRAHTAKTATAHLYHFYNNSYSTFLTFSHSILFSCFQSPMILMLHNNFLLIAKSFSPELRVSPHQGRATYSDKLFKFRNGRFEDLLTDDINEHRDVANRMAGRSVACVDRKVL